MRILLYFKKDEYLCTFDLKSGYHHIDIHINSQMYLGCEWKGKHYVFTVLPFGLIKHSVLCIHKAHKTTGALVVQTRLQGSDVH